MQSSPKRSRIPPKPIEIDSPQTPWKASQRWKANEELLLAEILRDSEKYQRALLKGRNPPGMKETKTTKINTTTLLKEISKKIYPEYSTSDPERIRIKIGNMTDNYRKELKQMGETGQGLLLEELRPDSALKKNRLQLIARKPWFEIWHNMMKDRAPVEPTSLLVSSGYGDDAEGNPSGTQSTSQVDSDSDLQMSQMSSRSIPHSSNIIDLDSSDGINKETHVNGRGLPGLERTAELSHRDPVMRGRSHTPLDSDEEEENIDKEGDNADEESLLVETTRSSKKGKAKLETPRKNISARETMSKSVNDAVESSFKAQIEIEKYITRRHEMQLEMERFTKEERRLERESIQEARLLKMERLREERRIEQEERRRDRESAALERREFMQAFLQHLQPRSS